MSARLSKPALGRGWLWGLAFVPIALAVIVGTPGGGASNRPQQAFFARGYSQIVSRIFAARGWLQLNLGADADGQLVQVRPDILSRPEVQDFYLHSFLKSDVAQNGAWDIDGLKINGVTESAHRISLPFAPETVWRGSLEFRDAAARALTLVGDNQSWRLERRTTRDAPSVPVDVYQTAPASPVEGGGQILELQVDRRPVAVVFAAGDRAVIRLTSAEVNVWIDGQPLRAAGGEAAYAGIDPGVQLVFQRKTGGPFAHLALADSGAALSRPQLLADRLRFPASAALAQGFERAMNGVTGARAGAPYLGLNVTTTLDSDLQAAVQSRLEAFCEDGKLKTGGRPFGCAATLMDATTGEILALGSYPANAAEIAGPQADASKTRLIRENQNFHRLSIGSSAKPLFAAALVQRYPELATLEISPYRGPDRQMPSLLGIALEPPLEEHPISDSRINFKTFIQKSSNKYASTLMLLGASNDPKADGTIPTGEPWWLNGKQRGLLPPLVFGSHARDDGLTGLDSPRNFTARVSTAQGSWPALLGALYDLPLYEDVASEATTSSTKRGGLYGGPIYDLKIWSPLLDALGPFAFRAFRDAGVAPERERLGMNVINDFRTDYLNLVIGGGRSQWSAVKLAESYARLVTGRQVDARLVQAVNGQPVAAAPPGPSQLNPGVRELMRGAMSQVIEEGGTASSLRIRAARDALARGAPAGHTVRIYAKTGTPTLESWTPSPQGYAVQDLAAAGVLSVAADSISLGVGPAGQAQVVPTRGRSIDEAARTLGRTREARRILDEHSVSALGVARYLAHYNTEKPGQKSLWLRIAAGKVYAAARLRNQGDTGESGDKGRVFAFVITDEPLGGGQPGRAYVMVVNIQNSWPVNFDAQGRALPAAQRLPENVAVKFATEFLERDMGRVLWPRAGTVR